MYELPGLWFNASELYALLSMQQLLEQVQPGLLEVIWSPCAGGSRVARVASLAVAEELPRRIRILQAAARQPSPHFALLAGAVAASPDGADQLLQPGRDQFSERQISPQRLTHYRDNWYLDGWCHLREGLRTFALDAIQGPQGLGGTGYRGAAARDGAATMPAPTASSPGRRNRLRCCDSARSGPAGSLRNSGIRSNRAVGWLTVATNCSIPYQSSRGTGDGSAQIRSGCRSDRASDTTRDGSAASAKGLENL